MVRLLEQGAACDLCGGGQEVPSAYFDRLTLSSAAHHLSRLQPDWEHCGTFLRKNSRPKGLVKLWMRWRHAEGYSFGKTW